MLRNASILTALISLAWIASCSEPYDPIECTTEFVYGLHIEIRDAETGEPAGLDATVVTTAKNYVDTLEVLIGPNSSVVAFGAGERPGTYDIRVEHPEYRTWEKTGVMVRADECHVIPVDVIVELERK
jgi:hypothetical protein